MKLNMKHVHDTSPERKDRDEAESFVRRKMVVGEEYQVAHYAYKAKH